MNFQEKTCNETSDKKIIKIYQLNGMFHAPKTKWLPSLCKKLERRCMDVDTPSKTLKQRRFNVVLVLCAFWKPTRNLSKDIWIQQNNHI